MQSHAKENDKVQEVSLIDLALVFIRFKRVFFLVFAAGLLLALTAALVLPERYQYTTLMQLAEKSSDEPAESPGALIGWLRFSAIPQAEALYRAEQSRKMPFELTVDLPSGTLLLKLTSEAEVVEQADVEKKHQVLASQILKRQKASLDRYVERLEGQLATAGETIELLRTMEDPGPALSEVLEREADIERRISDVRAAEIINVAQQSLEPVSKGPLFIVVVGFLLAIILASITTLVWALFSHARRRMEAS